MAVDEIQDAITQAKEERPEWTLYIPFTEIDYIVIIAKEYGVPYCLVAFIKALAKSVMNVLKASLKTLLVVLALEIEKYNYIKRGLEVAKQTASGTTLALEAILKRVYLPMTAMDDIMKLLTSCQAAMGLISTIQRNFTDPVKGKYDQALDRLSRIEREIQKVSNQISKLVDLQTYFRVILRIIERVDP